MSGTFSRGITSESTAEVAVVGEITRTGQRATNHVGGEELAVFLGTAIEFPETFGGRAVIALFAGVDHAVSTAGAGKGRSSSGI